MRISKVESLIKQHIADMLLHEIADPRIGFATITRVEVSKDLKFAKVYYSVLGSEEQKKQTKEGIDSAARFIQKTVASRLDTKFTPQLRFFLDKSPEKAIEIEQLFKKIKRER